MTAEANLVWDGPSGAGSFDCGGPSATIGKGAADLSIRDATVSRLHARIERVNGGWVLHDLGSRNGTFVNGARVVTPRALRSGDEVRFGSFVAVFRAAPGDGGASMTAPLAKPPVLTPRERDALVALTAPVLRGSMLEAPASIAAVAASLTVTESAVKKLLGRLYTKFDLVDDARTRGSLVAEAIRRGAVSVNDVVTPPPSVD